jgi:dUTP pyrophosphatase
MTAVCFKKLVPEAKLPTRATPESAGLDLYAVRISALQPGERCLVSTGLAASMPPGTEGQIRPRSGLALKSGVTVLNAPGTIDSDFRGEIKVLLINHGDDDFWVLPGERIAQLVIASCLNSVDIIEVESLDETERGSGGFGSTGV